MAFCDSLLWTHLYQEVAAAKSATDLFIGPENERTAAESLLANDGLGEEWKSVPLSASWSFWKDLTKPHNKVRHSFPPLLPVLEELQARDSAFFDVSLPNFH